MAGRVPRSYGLPTRCRAGSVLEAVPEDFGGFQPDFSFIMPEKLLDSVLAGIGRQQL